MDILANKVVLITGGGSGIGLATARGFLEAGARVAITGRNEAKLLAAAATLGGGDRLLSQTADVSQPDQVQALVRRVTDAFGPIDILVNNAGTNIKRRAMRELTPESWQLLIRSNLDGAFYCIHAVLPRMLERRDGLIINIVSTSGKRAGPLGGAAYAASKFGMHALGICLAAEERESGIRVSNIYPGEVDTPILEARPQAVTQAQRAQMLQPEDVAAAVLFVARLPPRVSVPELVIKPTTQLYI
ncbi:MAG: SDR family oxidoreductase [Gemmataceae bacterium]|nr:SDR family oxidoreductase [Gemmataceae bacterium]MDW8267195.1 SDR family oxidoreductase [Gemmataceae bacterium]